MSILGSIRDALRARRAPRTPEALFAAYDRKYGSKAEANKALARDTGKSLRQVQRHRRGEGLSSRSSAPAAYATLGQKMADERREQRLGQRGASVTFQGEIQVSDDIRHRDVTVNIGAADVRAFTAAAEGDVSKEFQDAFFEAWGMGRSASIVSVDSLEINIR